MKKTILDISLIFITKPISLKKIRFRYRIRYQQEFVNLFSGIKNSNIYFSGLRNKIALKYDLVKSHRLYASAEFFLLIEKLKEIFNKRFVGLKNSDIIKIENRKWKKNINLESEEEYLSNWIDNRLTFLDNYFENL